MKITNKPLFLKYAVHCGQTLVNRGNIPQSFYDDLKLRVRTGGNLTQSDCEVFKVARAMCEIIARRMKKSKIDTNVIRKYYLFEHDEVVEERFKEKHDFDPFACKVYPAFFDNKFHTPFGDAKINTTYFKPKPKTYLVFHYFTAIESINQQTAKLLWLNKNKYIPPSKYHAFT